MGTNVDVVENFQKAVIAGDVDAAVACFTDDGTYILAGGPEPGTTFQRSGIAGIFQEMIDRHSDSTVTWSDPVGVDDGRVLLEFTIADPDGKVLHRGVDLFEIRDGKIAVKDVFSKAW